MNILTIKTIRLMRNIFTLMLMLLCSSSGFAQQYEFQNLVINGDMEGEQDPEWSCFWVHEWRTPDEQFQGFANIVEDPLDPTNHCAKLVARSEEEAYANENPIEDSGHLASWDSQFFVYVNEALTEGKEVRLTMRIRAEKPTYGETQAHNEPGDYNFYQLFGNIDFTTEWQRVQVSTIITADQTQQNNDKEMHTVAFNLSVERSGNVYYFDDIKLEVRDQKGPEEFEGWFNLLRNGTLTADNITGSNFTTFTGRDGIDGRDMQARLITDTDGEPALNVTSIGYNAVKRDPILDEEGKPVLDENNEPTYNEQQVWVKYGGEKNDTITNIDNWQTQFFVSVNHKFLPGQKYKLVMWARADKDAQIETQAHTTPGNYVHWDMVGTLDLTTEWQKFEFGVDDDRTISNEQRNCQTIAFNCNVLKEENNYYFRFDDFSFNSADVTFDERVTGQESIALPIPDPSAEDVGRTVAVDFTNCLKKLETEDIQNLIDDDHTMVLKSAEEFSELGSASTGLMLNEEGLFDENGKIIIEVNPESEPDAVEFNIYNYGESFQGKRADTKIAFAFDGWYYVFNVAMVDEAGYNEYMGISHPTASLQPGADAIYDLTGRKLTKATKGLYIQNGKKYFVR